jgi:hypothetical protein
MLPIADAGKRGAAKDTKILNIRPLFMELTMELTTENRRN